MDTSVIAAASIDMSLSQTQQAANIAVLKKSMNVQQTDAEALIQSMGNISPNIGQRLDIRA